MIRGEPDDRQSVCITLNQLCRPSGRYRLLLFPDGYLIAHDRCLFFLKRERRVSNSIHTNALCHSPGDIPSRSHRHLSCPVKPVTEQHVSAETPAREITRPNVHKGWQCSVDDKASGRAYPRVSMLTASMRGEIRNGQKEVCDEISEPPG